VNSPPGAASIVELLDRLKTAVRELGARADKLNDEFRIKTGRERQQRAAALEEQNRQLAAATADADTAFENAKAAAQTNFEARKLRITRAYQSCRENALANVEKKAGRRKYELQKQMLQAEKDRDASFAAAATALAQFKADLAVEQEHLARLEGQTQRLFRGYRGFLRNFFGAYEKTTPPEAEKDETRLLSNLRELLGETRNDLDRFGRYLLLRLFKYLLVWVLIALGEIPLALKRFGLTTDAYWKAGGMAGGTLVFVFVVRILAQQRARTLATRISNALGTARRLHDVGLERADAHYQQELRRIADEYQNTTHKADADLKRALSQAAEGRVSCRMEADGKAFRILATNEQHHRSKLHRIEQTHASALEALTRASAVRTNAAIAASEEREKKITAEYQGLWNEIESEWKARLTPLYESISNENNFAEKLFPAWDAPVWSSWTPPRQFAQAAKFGRLDVDVERLCEGLPKDTRMILPGPAHFPAALCLAYPNHGSLLIETANTGHDTAISTLNNVMLRLLATSPAGRLNFTIIDPVGLGQNFAGVMHLADYEEQIITNRIWTQPEQIEERLAHLNEHMEKVIQMYLRNEYATIAEYNQQAGVIAEKYHFLVVADFPANFSEAAAKRLLSIAASGARCGVYMLIHWDVRQPLPQDFIPDELRKTCFGITSKVAGFSLTQKPMAGAELVLDTAPAQEFAIDFIHKIGEASRDSGRVEVPFAHVAPPEGEFWTEETTRELRVPIGRTGATKLQYLAIGKGTCQHALVAGKTGSGKSTLFHVVITNLALWCSPEQVEFYLVDFKKGVEFKCYASRRLPHARVVAIESDREFGLSVLQRVDEELKRRGDLFRALGVQDLSGYKRAGGTEPLPRTLLLIDEFQEYFVEDDSISQTASMLLDRIVRQGRAFGIHVLLGSQTLGGAYTVARTTLGQMVIRIALQCNEADAYLIMDENNPAPRLLSRPGEGIYNDMAGAIEGNSPFQTVWLPDQVRDEWLHKVRAHADQDVKPRPGPIVFEGNAPADVRENAELETLLETGALEKAGAPRIWMGAPNSIKGPTEAVFNAQTGSHLLIVGQNEEAILAILGIGLIALSAQLPRETTRIIFCDSTPPGSPQKNFLDHILQNIPQPITSAKPGDMAEILNGLSQEIKARSEDEASNHTPVFLLINGLQRFGKLRYEEDFSFSSSNADAPLNPAAALNNLISEGARLGIHVIATCDSYSSVGRFLSRKALTEFEMRVIFQMSANDSASLIDSPKASTLGLHRALFYNQQQGHLETFRPYALPSNEWIEMAGRKL
jgi:hypothetical protein